MNTVIDHLTIEDKNSIVKEVDLPVKIEEDHLIKVDPQDLDVEITPERDLQTQYI